MTSGKRRAVSCWIVFACLAQAARSQTGDLHGQASAWFAPNSDGTTQYQTGIRYIPDLLLSDTLGDGVDAGMELSLNSYAAARFAAGVIPSYEANLKPYRGWLRLSTDRFEFRAGLQKINFGSAQIFRPLMWFDRIDPRDPLQLTDGVYGALARYYFQNNFNIWLWGLYGNSNTKGWEIAPTESRTAEYGGRIQSPLLTGEIGLTYHHRRVDMRDLIPVLASQRSPFAPEDRFGIDGKWDLGIGLWGEGAIVRQEPDLPGVLYGRQWTVGADYTFDVGSGLYAATEYFRSDAPVKPFTSGPGYGFSALTVNYPVNMVDRISAIVYRDWTNDKWYRLITWQRTLDNWSFYLLGFWDPDAVEIPNSQAGTNSFAGVGFQFIMIFNH